MDEFNKTTSAANRNNNKSNLGNSGNVFQNGFIQLIIRKFYEMKLEELPKINFRNYKNKAAAAKEIKRSLIYFKLLIYNNNRNIKLHLFEFAKS